MLQTQDMSDNEIDDSDQEDNKGQGQGLQAQQQQLIEDFNNKFSKIFKGLSITIKCSTNKSFFSLDIKILQNKKSKIIYKMQYRPQLFYICSVDFKVEEWKVYQESEKLTKKYQEFMRKNRYNNNIIEILCNAVDELKFELQDSYNLFSKQFNTSQKQTQTPYTFDQSFLHQNPIPYPAQTSACWSPHGHLVTVHNQLTQYQKQARDDQKKYIGYELNQFVFSSKKTQEMKELKHFVDIQEQDEEFQKAFMQQGMKIISESKEEDYDYLNFEFYSHMLPQIQWQQQKQQQVQTSQWTKNYEFIDLNDHQYDLIKDQFRNLYKKVESQDKKILINQNTYIYDFSCYSYNIQDNIRKLHEHYSVHFKKGIQNKDVQQLQLLYDCGLEDYVKLYSSNLKQFLLKQEYQQYNMDIIKIIMDNIYQEAIKNVKNYRMNLLIDVLQYSKYLWDTIYSIYEVYDQLIKQIENTKYQNQSQQQLIVKQLTDNKINLIVRDEEKFLRSIQDMVNDIIKYLNKNAQPTQLQVPKVENGFIKQLNYGTQKLLNRIQKFVTYPERYLIQTNIGHSYQVTVPYIKTFNQTYELAILGNALRVFNVQQFCLFKKFKARGFQLMAFIQKLNEFINSVNDNKLAINTQRTKQLINNDHYYCSVCQIEILSGQIILCNECNHGGHFSHILQWFSKKDRQCPQCFTCQCQNVTYYIISAKY